MYQTSLLNATDLRDMGMQQAEDNANRQVPDWSNDAMTYLKSFLVDQGSIPFQAEDFRIWAISKGLQEPPTWRAIGGIIVRARRDGLIKFVKIEATSAPTAHSANASVWIKA